MLLALVLGLVLTPSLAVAAFHDTAQDSMSVSTAQLEAPAEAGTQMWAWCFADEQSSLMVVYVRDYAKVANANHHQLSVTGPRGKRVHSSNVETFAGNWFVRWADKADMAGVWKYELRGSYHVPGSDNVWTGEPLQGQRTCAPSNERNVKAPMRMTASSAVGCSAANILACIPVDALPQMPLYGSEYSSISNKEVVESNHEKKVTTTIPTDDGRTIRKNSVDPLEPHEGLPCLADNSRPCSDNLEIEGS